MVYASYRQCTWWTWLESVKLFHPVLFLLQLTSNYATPTTNPDCFKLPSKMIGCSCAIAPPLCSQQQPFHCVFNYVCKAQPELFHFCSTAMTIDNSNMIATSICSNLIGQNMVFKSQWSRNDLYFDTMLFGIKINAGCLKSCFLLHLWGTWPVAIHYNTSFKWLTWQWQKIKHITIILQEITQEAGGHL